MHPQSVTALTRDCVPTPAPPVRYFYGEILTFKGSRAPLSVTAAVSAVEARFMTTREPTALEHIRGTFPELDAWGLRSASLNVPELGSDLHVDDQQVIGWHTSQLATAGLGAARNHLQAVRVHIDAGQSFPDATGTLIRGAMLGAAQAVWLLAPADHRTRMKRTRVLAVEVMDNHRKALVDLLKLDPTHENTKQAHAHVEKRLAEVRERREQLGESADYNNTTLIEQAAVATLGKSLDVEARYEWRKSSGNAHGLPWAMLGMSGTAQTSVGGADGFAEFTTGGAFDDFVNGYFLAYRMLGHGWSLYDLRARAGAAGPQAAPETI